MLVVYKLLALHFEARSYSTRKVLDGTYTMLVIDDAGSHRTAWAAYYRPPQVVQLGDPRGRGQEAVCSLAFSRTGTLLLAGHASGDVVFWEWHRTVWQSVKHVKGAPACLTLQ